MAADQQRGHTDSTSVETFESMAADSVVEASRAATLIIIKACIQPDNMTALPRAMKMWKDIFLAMYRLVIQQFDEAGAVNTKEVLQTMVLCTLIVAQPEVQHVRDQLHERLNQIVRIEDDYQENPAYIQGTDLLAQCNGFLKWLEAGGSESTAQEG